MNLAEFRSSVLLVSMLCLSRIVLSGQNNITTIPYYCGFEDTVENANWVLNSGPYGAVCHDKWYTASATAYEGVQSLYISNDGGVNPVYGTGHPNVVVAYRSMVLPVGTYDISFDWKNMATGDCGLYVCIITASDDSISNPASGFEPAWVQQTKQNITVAGSSAPVNVLRASPGWTNASFTYRVLTPNRRVKLAFVWTNDNRDNLSNPLSACIDNIQITSNKCPKPTNFTAVSSCDSIYLAWEAFSASYELEYRKKGARSWKKIQLTEKEYTFKGLLEGGYDFRLRGICYQDTSAYVSNYSAVVFCPESHCINYVDLTRDNGVKCYIGEAGRADFTEMKEDYGADDVRSRHTVCWSQDQFDPRTGGLLPVVPPGAVASVRLGNWLAGNGAERIEYQFTADSAFSILLLKYAVVLQDPDQGHTSDQKPKFKLEILDEAGNLISPDCGVADFFADRNRDGWNDGEGSGDAMVTWKNWTTLGVNLENHIGESLTIRLTTQDCTEGAHYGYAYFTLDCTEGEIKGMSCGDDPKMDLSAPEGFKYDWTNSDDPDFHSDRQTVSVDADDVTTYYCRCSFLENEGCYFDLSSVVEPRYPKAVFSYELIRRECRNVVEFTNTSHVVARMEGVDIDTDDPCESYIWEFGGLGHSFDSDPEFTFPDEGGTFDVRLTGLMSGGNCDDDTIVTIEIPPVVSYLDTVRDTVCFGGSRVFCDQYLMNSDTVVCHEFDRTGCDSTTVLIFTVLPPLEDIEVFDTICFGESLLFDGVPRTESGDYEKWITNGKGCRGVEILHLHVRDKVTFTCTHTDVVDAPNTGSITIDDAPDGYTYLLDGVDGASLDGLAGGEYEVVVRDSFGCESEKMYVTVGQECLELTLDSVLPVCADEDTCRVGVVVQGGYVGQYSLRYGDKARKAGFADESRPMDDMFVEFVLPEKCRPDIYDVEIVFHDAVCGDVVMPVKLPVYYPSDIIVQKWNDVLAVTNNRYNGGYDFSAFQWYRNDTPLVGEVNPTLYLGGGNVFDTADLYSVMLTRTDDGVSVPVCPVRPGVHADEAVFPTLVSASAPHGYVVRFENVIGSMYVQVFDASGQLCASCVVDEYNTEVLLPGLPGVYIIVMSCGTGQRSYKVAVW